MRALRLALYSSQGQHCLFCWVCTHARTHTRILSLSPSLSLSTYNMHSDTHTLSHKICTDSLTRTCKKTHGQSLSLNLIHTHAHPLACSQAYPVTVTHTHTHTHTRTYFSRLKLFIFHYLQFPTPIFQLCHSEQELIYFKLPVYQSKVKGGHSSEVAFVLLNQGYRV